MSRIRVAIIGQGRSGLNIHTNSLSGMKEQYEIVAIADAVPERLERAKRDYGCDVVADYNDLLGRTDIDLIVNAAPSQLHVPVTRLFLENGFNVVCEKPVARTVAELDMLEEAAKRSGKLLVAFHQKRYTPGFVKVKELIDSGIIGRVVHVSIVDSNFSRRWDWQTLQANNGGNLLNNGPHSVDQALQIFGTDLMPNVTCFMDRANTSGDAEDYVKVILHGKGRPVIDIEVSSCNSYPNCTYHIQGTNGGIKGTTTHLDWKYFKPEEAQEHELDTKPIANEQGEPAYCREQLKWYEESWDYEGDPSNKKLMNTMTETFYNMLYQTIIHKAPLEVTLDQVRQRVAVIEECHRQNQID
ncbi:Gfo/Idh/MocA family protein [Paenibacillus radicis (ex Xue et al. 2023)]|uniref:Gfo/Idh/MocA family oxidoreductase n=1 Tax=Paenibacillus radicis (ex Xue et al. 2023) TaxID=2972489 RepID=A0ABT1YTL3_9BACL|nr:Gfo/Idh/MocA family oxidoreductase [Paenibacillus radicis (ex Xue et al. 2023)]MCR8635325.1 Gfo/Idh/MocA family oxidoreductase [Paenibacillus radicis (ex Xue et al. 2023)]